MDKVVGKGCTVSGWQARPNNLTSVCSGCGGILRLRRELLETIRGSNGFYIRHPDEDKYFYNVVENIQGVATQFWVKVRQEKSPHQCMIEWL